MFLVLVGFAILRFGCVGWTKWIE